jgi:penicillin-binding protein 1A
MNLRRSGTSNKRYLFWATYGLAILGTAAVGLLAGLMFGYAFEMPGVEQLQRSRPDIVSYVYSDDGRILGQFAHEKRILVTYEQIPEVVKQAVVSVEDANFFKHTGIDFRRFLVAVVRDIVLGERKGASTLTMQLSKTQFTSTEKTIRRKILDMLYAIEIEKNYSKEQIFTFYCNQIHLGHGTYGLAAGADYYFHKTLDQLTVAEAALLAGLIRYPVGYSPINRPASAVNRRNFVLSRMHREGYIDDEALAKHREEPLVVYGRNYDQTPAAYFVEWVRQYMERNYRTDDILRGGLKIHTTLDYRMQEAANRALQEGLKKFDKERRRWTAVEDNLLDKVEDLERHFLPEWTQIFYQGMMVQGLVLESSPHSARVKIGTYTATIRPDDIAWTRQKQVDAVLKRGDLAVFTLKKINQSDKTIEAVLDRRPIVQGGFIAVENQTGAIRAMVGGFDFQHSKFNRATQARRQPGSIFKPFTYVAAIESGYSPLDTVLDAPVNYPDALGRPYMPSNADGEFKGLITIDQALHQSRNVPTIRLANALGIHKVIEVAERFGLRGPFPPYLPVALGAAEATLEEVTSAFTVFPNNGVRCLPFFIKRVEDFNGLTLEEHQHRVEEVLDPETAGKLLYMLRQVTLRGTAASVGRQLKHPLGGKTGTTNDFTDSWFVGFTPSLTAGVWAGHDEKRTLGNRVYGATLALPIWIDFMQEVLKDQPEEQFETGYIPSPSTPVERTQIPVTAAPQREIQARPIIVEDIAPPSL